VLLNICRGDSRLEIIIIVRVRFVLALAEELDAAGRLLLLCHKHLLESSIIELLAASSLRLEDLVSNALRAGLVDE